jgi:hypothetical protein
MNPLDWNRQHQVAGIAFCANGAIVGIFFAWMDSPFRQLSSHSISGVVGRYDRCFLALAVARRSLLAVASFRRVRRGIGILRSTAIEALTCGQGLKPSPAFPASHRIGCSAGWPHG